MWGEPGSDNDSFFKEYRRLLRSYYRIAWETHDCSYCKEPIDPGDEYWGEVWIAVEEGKKKFWVEKKHYPECPEDLFEIEEMHRQWADEDRERARNSLRKAA